MNSDKHIYTYIIVLGICSFINILVCINILPFDVWRVGLIVVLLANLVIMMISSKKKNIMASNNKKMIIICWSALIIWAITLFATLIIK